MNESIAGYLFAGDALEARFLIDPAELRDFEILRFLQRNPRNDLFISSGSEAWRDRMALIAGKRVAIQTCSVEKLRATCGIRSAGWIGQSSIQVLVRIRSVRERPDEILERSHLGRCKLACPTQQRYERRVECRQVCTIATPMKRLGSNNAPQRLCGHWPFHRMKRRRQHSTVYLLQSSQRIPEVPRNSVAMAVCMTAGTGEIAMGRQRAVIKSSPANSDA